MSTDTDQNKELGDLRKNMVGWKVFGWAMGVVLVLFGTAFASIASISTKVDDVKTSYTEIQTQLAQIQTDLTWLKQAMGKDTK